MMIKKYMAFILTAAVTVSVMAGCSGTPTEKKEGAAASEAQKTEKKELVFWIRGSENENISKVLSEDVDLYNQKQDGLSNVTVEFIPYADFITKYNAAFAGGTAPDIIDTGEIALRVNLNQHEPLDDYIAQWEDKDEVADYLDAGYMEGKTYGVLFSPSTYLFFWRKDYFKEAGLDPESPPKDWEEMMEYAKLLTIKDGDNVVRGGFSVDVTSNQAPMLFTVLARQAGSHLYDDTTGAPAFNDKGGVEALQYILDIAPYSKLHTPAPGANEPVPFIAGTAAMGYVTTETISTMLTNDPSMKEKIGVAAYVPKAGGTDITWCGYRLYAISAGSKYKDEAWDFIEYSMSEERMRAKMETADVVPVRTGLQKEFESMDEFMHPAMVKAVSVGECYPKKEWASSYNGIALRDAQQEALYGQKSVQEALDDAVDRIKQDYNLK